MGKNSIFGKLKKVDKSLNDLFTSNVSVWKEITLHWVELLF